MPHQPRRRLGFAIAKSATLALALLCQPVAAQDRTRMTVNPSAERGRQVAERVCAACHAITAQDDSPLAMAPPFKTLRMRYNPISMERHIGALASAGYYGMPPQRLSPGEAEEVAAYIDTVGP